LQTGQYGGGIWMSSCNSSTYGFSTISTGMGSGRAVLLERFAAIDLMVIILRTAAILVSVDIFLNGSS